MEEPREVAVIYPEDFSLLSTQTGDKIAVSFVVRNPEDGVLREVQTWLPVEEAARLSSHLAFICQQFGFEPKPVKQTKQ